MKYTIEFEVQSDLDENATETIYRTLVTTFGRIDNFRIVPKRTYVGYIRQGAPFQWREIGANTTSKHD